MFVVNDVLDAVFLGSFFFGLIFSGMSLFLGIADLGIGHFTGDHGAHGVHFGHHDGAQDPTASDQLSAFSVGTILGFLTWFGGVAYLARNGLHIYSAISLLLGVGAGLAGAYIIFWLLRKVKSQEAGVMRAADDFAPGTIARVTSSIRAGGTGEIIYEQRGVRQVSAARSQSGRAIPRGTEVVILRHAAGVAHVEPWESLVGDGFDELEAGRERQVLDMPPPEPRTALSPDTFERTR